MDRYIDIRFELLVFCTDGNVYSIKASARKKCIPPVDGIVSNFDESLVIGIIDHWVKAHLIGVSEYKLVSYQHM
jgi:hypothetical protein